MNNKEAVYYLARNYKKGMQKTLSIEVKGNQVEYLFDGTYYMERLNTKQALDQATQDVINALERQLIKAEDKLTDLCF